jgi:hypothetical protein
MYIALSSEILFKLAVSKQTTHRFHMERFNLKILNEVQDEEKYRIEISNRFAVWKT